MIKEKEREERTILEEAQKRKKTLSKTKKREN
jgi:hypothetical protein